MIPLGQPSPLPSGPNQHSRTSPWGKHGGSYTAFSQVTLRGEGETLEICKTRSAITPGSYCGLSLNPSLRTTATPQVIHHCNKGRKAVVAHLEPSTALYIHSCHCTLYRVPEIPAMTIYLMAISVVYRVFPPPPFSLRGTGEVIFWLWKPLVSNTDAGWNLCPGSNPPSSPPVVRLEETGCFNPDLSLISALRNDMCQKGQPMRSVVPPPGLLCMGRPNHLPTCIHMYSVQLRLFPTHASVQRFSLARFAPQPPGAFEAVGVPVGF